MAKNKINSDQSQRIIVIDALRGFALLGVILMHMLDHFGYTTANMLGESSHLMWDAAVQWLSDKVIRGKFISIFSFLFGLSFYIQMERASKKGIDFRGRFLWRMALLFMIGMIGTSFSYLDILTIYAVSGVILVFLFPLRSWFLMLIVCLLLIGIPNLFIIGLDNITMEQTTLMNLPTIPEQPTGDSNFENATFLESAKENLTTKTIDKLKFQFIYGGSGYLILALFITGFVVGRLRFFEQVHIKRKKNISLLVLFLFSSFVIWLTVKFLEPKVPFDLLKTRMEGGVVPLTALMISSLTHIRIITISGAIVMGFISLYQIAVIRKYLNLLSPYGRMGLTNYEMQSVIGAVLFSTWGFGSIFGGKGAAELFVLGLIIYLLQVVISELWMKRFMYGPLEWLWRSGTYLKWQPYVVVVVIFINF